MPKYVSADPERIHINMADQGGRRPEQHVSPEQKRLEMAIGEVVDAAIEVSTQEVSATLDGYNALEQITKIAAGDFTNSAKVLQQVEEMKSVIESRGGYCMQLLVAVAQLRAGPQVVAILQTVKEIQAATEGLEAAVNNLELYVERIGTVRCWIGICVTNTFFRGQSRTSAGAVTRRTGCCGQATADLEPPHHGLLL